jgi:hypothetical protein
MLHPKSAIFIVPYILSLYYNYQAIKQVFWLNISVNNVFRMKILQGMTQLSDVIRSSIFSVPLIRLFLEILIELTTRSIFKDQIDLFIVPEETVHSQNIVMSQMALYFYLSSQLMFYIRLHKLFLVKHFESNNEFRLLLSCKINMTKLSSSERFSNFKIINSPLFWLKFFRLLSLILFF